MKMHLSGKGASSATTLRSRTAGIALLTAISAVAGSSRASTFFWDPLALKTATGSTGAGTWDAATASNWYPGSGTTDVTWSSTRGSDIASFKGALAAGGATVTVS